LKKTATAWLSPWGAYFTFKRLYSARQEPVQASQVAFVSIANGDEVLFMNGHFVASSENGLDDSLSDIAANLCKANNVRLTEIKHETPTEEDWTFNDIEAILKEKGMLVA